MKTKKISRKLSFKKQTVSNLNKRQQDDVLGGRIKSYPVATCELTSCVPYATGCAPAVDTDCAFPTDVKGCFDPIIDKPL